MLRLGSLNPDEISENLIELMASNERIARHLHIPLQSGSDRVLKKMARSYRSKKFEEVVNRAIKYMPLVNVGSDVIVGFPSETEKDFADTFQLIESLPVGYLHVFRYSDRSGTRASQLDKCATSEVITERAREIKKLGASKKKNFHLSMVGKTLPAVYEKKIGSTDFLYRSTNYLKVFSSEHTHSSQPVLFTIMRVVKDGLEGDSSSPKPGSDVRI
jgi:threonylcarbamoyladenosine tRNA methylthiotransferase MtaB